MSSIRRSEVGERGEEDDKRDGERKGEKEKMTMFWESVFIWDIKR